MRMAVPRIVTSGVSHIGVARVPDVSHMPHVPDVSYVTHMADVPYISHMSNMADIANVADVADVPHACIVADVYLRQVQVARQERHQRVTHADAQTGEVDYIYCLHITPRSWLLHH